MTLSRRAIVLAGAALAGGCGFRPLYGAGGAGGALDGQVALEGLSGRAGYHFRQTMRGRVGDPGPEPRYVLAVDLDLEDEGLAITPEDDVTRISLTGRARWTLRDRAAGGEALTGEARATSAYNTTGTPFATRVAAEDAERRVAQDLAERVFAQIAGRLGADEPAPAA
jgi:LPS-assembly lipoprotein